MIDTTICPECGELAQVQDRAVLESTSGPVEHAKVMCVRRHWFLLPVDQLRTPQGKPAHSGDASRSSAQNPPTRETGRRRS
jgi:hypothetical protein